MDDAMRARLETTRLRDLGNPLFVADIRALLAAYDDAREHIQTLEAVMKSDATLNRLQADNAQLRRTNLDLVHRVDRAAPVLAAAADVDEIIDAAYDEVPFDEQMRIDTFHQVIAAWRAAREG